MRVLRRWCSLVAVICAVTSAGVAQSSHGSAALTSCGPAGASFRIKQTQASPAVSPETGTALVYFVAEDQGGFLTPTTLAGVDGQWVGATHGTSWFYFRVSPGEHHLCALANPDGNTLKALARFTAVAGGVYYFEAKDLTWSGPYEGWSDLTLQPLNSDEGQYLLSTEEFSLSEKR